MSCFPLPSLKDLSDQVEFETGSALTDIGLIAPFDFVLDREYWEWIPANVSLHITRSPFLDQQVGVAMAEQVSEDEVLTAAARKLTIADPAVTVFACTSGSFIHGLAGEQRCRQAILAGGARRALTTSGALVEALTAFGITSCAFLGLKGDIFRVSPGTVYRLVRAADCEDAEAIFISCTNLWTREVLSTLEHELGKPVLSANQVTVWAALKAVGAKGEVPGQRLFTV